MVPPSIRANARVLLVPSVMSAIPTLLPLRLTVSVVPLVT